MALFWTELTHIIHRNVRETNVLHHVSSKCQRWHLYVLHQMEQIVAENKKKSIHLITYDNRRIILIQITSFIRIYTKSK